MTVLELVCLVVVVAWLVLRLGRAPDRPALLRQFLAIAVAAFVGEDTCIRLYGFYFYARDRWGVFVDEVPLLILLIWPVVVTSALDLARGLKVTPRRLPLLLLVLVVVDAWFIEPIAADAGLWTWTHPGPFDVPVIGVLGWGCFAAGFGVVVARGWPLWSSVIVAPLLCHAALLLLWWGALRWLPSSSSDLVPAVAVWIVALLVVALVVKERPSGLRPLVVLRVPAAFFFFGLLWLHADVDDDRLLLVWSLAFAPPWLALMVLSPSSSSSS